MPSGASSLLLLAAQALLLQTAHAQQVDSNFYQRPGVTGAEILRARGFLAEEHFFTTHDGYTLKMTRGTSPLFNRGKSGLAKRAPILFIPGAISSPTSFLVNSFDARPRDLSRYDLKWDAHRMAREPSAKSLPFLAMNCGHEVWLLSPRGRPGSQRLRGNPNSVEPSNNEVPAGSLLDLGNSTGTQSLLGGRFSLQTFSTAPAAFADYGQLPELIKFSFDANFWNFSYDEQTQFDIPQAIKFVLKKTGRPKLALVGHSAGGLLILTTLAEFPELASNVTIAVNWAPAFGLGNLDLPDLVKVLEPVAETYVGSFPPAFLTFPAQALLGLMCATGATQRTLCPALLDVLFGPSGGQEPLYPEFIVGGLFATGAREFAQLLQTVRLGGLLHKYDYGEAGNLAAYNQTKPPPYELSKIRLPNMSFYAGATDTLVSPLDVLRIILALKVPYKFTLIEPFFNHGGFYFHDDTARRAIVPSLWDIQNAGN